MKFTAHFSRLELAQIVSDDLKARGFEMESLSLFDEHSEHVEFSFASAPVSQIQTDTRPKERDIWYGVYLVDDNEVIQWGSFSTMPGAEKAVSNFREKLPGLSFCIRAY